MLPEIQEKCHHQKHKADRDHKQFQHPGVGALRLLPLWLLIGGAGSALGMASLMRPAFAQLEKAGRKEEEPEEETPDGGNEV